MIPLNLSSKRAQKARLGARLSRRAQQYLTYLAVGLILLGLASHFTKLPTHLTFAALAIGLLAAIIAAWWHQDLGQLPIITPAKTLDDVIEPNLLAKLKPDKQTPADLWQAATSTWPGHFITNHLLIYDQAFIPLLSPDSASVWQKAQQLALAGSAKQLDGAHLVTALILTSNGKEYLASLNLNQNDVLEVLSWQQRLASYLGLLKPHYGGIGRDWAAGFTPLLNHFGINISRGIESGQAGLFDSLAHADVLSGVVHSLVSASGVALVGEAGSGKTSLSYALAQRLISGQDEALKYYQVVSLDAAAILAAGHNLERLLLNLFSEAALARNIILFLDDASLFFGQGLGAFNISQLLAPLMQEKAIKLMAAFTPADYQRFKEASPSLASSFAVINIAQPDQPTTMKILEDTALTIEQKEHLLIPFQAVREAYRSADQYIQTQAFPGKAINLMTQAVAYAHHQILGPDAIATAIEKSLGIKTARPKAEEANTLLNLEDRIHQRMINQERAVSAVAAALRRGRAGVGSPNRPVGAFLFLGPTGVGKTELARSLAATYFGSAEQMIRLDMTEYSGPDATARLIDSGTSAHQTLILAIRSQPFSVVLLDEVEKASPPVLNLLLQLIDEGRLTDQNGQTASFKNAIIICTSNAGSADISSKVAAGESLDNFTRPLVDKLISQNTFKPELINRFDEVVLFRPLNQTELAQVARLMLDGVNRRLASQNLEVALTEAALNKIVEAGYDPQFGARPMRRTIQQMVEDVIAKLILAGQVQPGTLITLDEHDLGVRHD